jgi:hypothetical protein
MILNTRHLGSFCPIAESQNATLYVTILICPSWYQKSEIAIMAYIKNDPTTKVVADYICKVETALENPEYEWRTVKGVVTETKFDESKV